jgi:myo-inositol-1(or 4)-monophosphatase
VSISQTEREVDWLALCRRCVDGLTEMLAAHPTTGQRAVQQGRGEGGDIAVFVDRAAEDVIFQQLDKLHADGLRFCALSEERGEVSYGGEVLRVIIDPIDGSLNAKRGLPHHAVSIAVADGPTMADVQFGYVFDFGAREEWSARRGQGARLNGQPLTDPPPERRTAEGLIELVAIESASPRWIAMAAEGLQASVHRVRALGTIAVSMCQLAATRVDGMVTLWRCRAVDVAAAQLIVRESGGEVAFTAYEDPLGAPLDLVPHSAVVAARTPETLKQLGAITQR